MSKVQEGAVLPYSMGFLMERYKVRQQSLNEYVKNHLVELNADGIHARKVGKEWRFDGTAIRILDELRNFAGEAVVVSDYETAENARIRDLEKELAEAKDDIEELKLSISIKESFAVAQQKLLDQVINERDRQLLLTSQAEAKEVEQAKEIERLEAESVIAQGEIKELEKRAMEAENALAEERSKSLWKLIVERFTK